MVMIVIVLMRVTRIVIVGMVVTASRAMLVSGGMRVTVVVLVVVSMVVLMAMLMSMAVVVPVVVIMIMIVPVIVIMTMGVIAILMYHPGARDLGVVMAVAAAVRSRFGLEGRIHRRDARTEPAQHLLEHVVGGNAQMTGADFDRYVPVAQVVGRAGQRLGRRAGHVQHLLGFGDHFDDAAVARHNQVAAAQYFTARQAQRDFFAGSELRAQTGFLAGIERKLQAPLHIDAVSTAADLEFVSDFEHVGF
jgi:hypothetical protein